MAFFPSVSSSSFLLFSFSLLLLPIPPTLSYKVLVFSPTLSRSHMISNARVADALARDGHNVTLLELDFIVPVNSFNASKLASVWRIPGPFMDTDFHGQPFSKLLSDMAFRPESLVTSFFMSKSFQQRLNNACEAFLTTQKHHLALLKEQKFDVIITEQLNFCGTGMGHLLGIPTHILLSSCPLQEHVSSLLGLPFPSSYVPSLFDSSLSDKMSLSDRFHNLLRQAAAATYLYYGVDPLTQIFRKHFGRNFPDLRSIVSQSPLVFVAVDELVDFPRPIFPNVIYIGGLGTEELHQKRSIALKEPFASEMAKGDQGVVFFSMGSIMRTSDMPESFRRHIFEAFAKIPNYHFIVKVDKEDNFTAKLVEGMPNVFLTPWAPQSELLGHPRLRLFITHGGYNSLLEAARAGVPLISMGFFADQNRNSRVAERNGWALPFEKRELLEGSDRFREAIRRVIEEPSYAAKAKRIQKLLNTKPFTAEERLTKNVRFLELNGGHLPELLSESRNLSTVQLYNLDLALLAFALLAILLFILWKLAKFARKIVRRLIADQSQWHKAKTD